MGIFMKTEKPRKRSDRILELEEEGELEMTDGIFQSKEFDHLRMDDVSSHADNSPRRESQIGNDNGNDGQGIYESVAGPITPK